MHESRLLIPTGVVSRMLTSFAAVEVASPAVADLSVAVIVPTYRRPEMLRRCLGALAEQSRSPDRIVVVIRIGDSRSGGVALRACGALRQLELVSVREPGQVAALSAALARCMEDIVVHTDDDAAPHRDWLERLVAQYRAGVGGVGGRDVLPTQIEGDPRAIVGRLSWFGRLRGNHHLGEGEAREVDVLKGVNMSLRRELWRMDHSLRGEGAQVHNEIGLCLQALRDGWSLIYDPAVRVDHASGARYDEDKRDEPTVRARANAEFNYAYSLARWLPTMRLVPAALYLLLIGTRGAPGLALGIAAMTTHPADGAVTVKVVASLAKARLDGVWRGLCARRS